MGILNRIGLGKKKADLPKAPKEISETREKKTGKPIKEKLSKQLATKAKSHKRDGDLGLAHANLVRPIISEKGTALAGMGKYVFAVSLKANKSEIKKSVERVYGVDVVGVNVIKMPGKLRRYGRSVGRTSAWKKAVVTLAKGQKISGIMESVGQ